MRAGESRKPNVWVPEILKNPSARAVRHVSLSAHLRRRSRILKSYIVALILAQTRNHEWK